MLQVTLPKVFILFYIFYIVISYLLHTTKLYAPNYAIFHDLVQHVVILL